MRYIPQLMKNIISVGALKVQDLRETLGEDIIKMFNGSLIALKGIRRNSLYYLKSGVVIENLVASECIDSDSTRLWQMRLRDVGLDSLQALAK